MTPIVVPNSRTGGTTGGATPDPYRIRTSGGRDNGHEEVLP